MINSVVIAVILLRRMRQINEREKMKLLDKLSDLVEKSENFRRIMSDGVVDDAELEAQGKLVEELIEKLENQLSDSDFELVSNLISELSVFHLISNYR